MKKMSMISVENVQSLLNHFKVDRKSMVFYMVQVDKENYLKNLV